MRDDDPSISISISFLGKLTPIPSGLLQCRMRSGGEACLRSGDTYAESSFHASRLYSISKDVSSLSPHSLVSSPWTALGRTSFWGILSTCFHDLIGLIPNRRLLPIKSMAALAPRPAGPRADSDAYGSNHVPSASLLHSCYGL